MKCIILAGGRGNRLWPLSRESYPKQFIRIQTDHSIFQETIVRNMPFCDEFIIVTNIDYRFIVENQLSAFQGLTHRCVFEGIGRKTAAAITLACMQLPLSETVLVVPADQLVSGNAYKEDVLHAKELSEDGMLVTFGMPIVTPEERFGYIRFKGEDVLCFTEKPNAASASQYQKSGNYLINSGMFVFCVGNYLKELRNSSPSVYSACEAAFKMRQIEISNLFYRKEVMRFLPAVPVEKAVFEKTVNAKVVHASFDWKDIGSLEDLEATELHTTVDTPQIQHNCQNVEIVNQCPRRLVLTNGIRDILVVNTKDAVYVGRKGCSNELKTILEQNPLIKPFAEGGRVLYRQWGSYELLVDQLTYRVKKVIINIGRTIYAHKHLYRSEHWSVVSGYALIELDGISRRYKVNDIIEVNPEVVHQVSNVGNEPLTIIEVSVGENVSEEDNVPEERKDTNEGALGIFIEPFVKLAPTYMDYLWGGTRLKDIYGKKCDYEQVAESWELSAHEAGQSIVVSGRHKGMPFGEYLNVIGKENLGWKCSSLEAFPILIKLIDAKQSLSIQVHPDDDYALTVENQYGKNEMWYILDAIPGSYLYCGFVRDVTRDEVRMRIQDDTLPKILNKVPVKKGDVYFIPAGTVHAIGAGILICEIQQSSNCTYRLYDFGRKDKFGNLRELHIEKGLDVLTYNRYIPQKLEDTVESIPCGTRRIISSCKYFECIYYSISGEAEILAEEESFTSLLCIAGEGTICINQQEEIMAFKLGESIFMPKTNGLYKVCGKCELIITRV